MDIESKVAEVIAASSAEFHAQCYRLNMAPALGSLVKVSDNSLDVYGVIYNVETQSMDQGRRIVARGENLDSTEDIFRANPQLTRLLTTNFNALVVGYRTGDTVSHFLPPHPVPLHGFIYVCDNKETEMFTRSLDFISLIINAQLSITVDEVLTACLRNASRTHPDAQGFLMGAGKELAWLLQGDAKRLNSVLKRLRP